MRLMVPVPIAANAVVFEQRVTSSQRNGRTAQLSQPIQRAAAAGIVNCIRARLRQS